MVVLTTSLGAARFLMKVLYISGSSVKIKVTWEYICVHFSIDCAKWQIYFLNLM